MAMRLDLEFGLPLTSSQRVDFLIALAGLGTSRRTWLMDGGRAAIVIGEALDAERTRTVMQEWQVPVREVVSSLNEGEDVPPEDGPVPEGDSTGRSRPGDR